MDFDQSRITTIHDFGYDRAKSLKQLEEFSEERPIGLVLPVAYGEVECKTLPRILSELNRATFLNNVTVALYADSQEEFGRVVRFFKQLEIPHKIIWCNGPNINYILEDLKQEGIDITQQGKGRDCWIALGVASVDSYAIVMHDADIVNYSYEIPMKLAYPVVDPNLDYFFNKGYYVRIDYDSSIFYGRVARLFLYPLLEAFQIKTNYKSEFLHYLRSFKYPLSGEIALTADLALNIRIPMDWGLEVGTLYEVYRSVANKRICQTDLGFFDHKHHDIGSSRSEGLLKMAGDILVTLLRALTEVEGSDISPSFLHSLRVLYLRMAQNSIRQYHADATCNQLNYNRNEEENAVESFETVIMSAGEEYMNAPSSVQIPDWHRATSAKPKLKRTLINAILEDEKAVVE
jgi:glucosyl-3-phosphoglycerate synthase